MHKCFKCGTEFEGNFCPNCGLKWEEEKVCPKCGAKLPSAVKFCTQCGHSFFGGEPVSYSRPRTESGGAALQKWFYALRFFPFAALALFSVLLFAFFAAPVAEMVMGAGLPNVSIGNAYSLHGGLSEVPGIGGATTALIVFAVICIVFSCAFGVFMFVPKLKYKSLKSLNNAMFPELFGYASFVFYPIIMMIGIFIMVKISYADEGMGLLVSGACPVLLIAFSIVFALVAVGSFIARRLLANGHPVLLKREKQMEDRYFQAEKERKAQYYATHIAPVLHPVIGDKKANKQVAIVYKHEKRRYDKAKEGKTPNAVIWMDLNKLPLLIGAAVLSVAIILISILVPILTNKFRVSVLEKIDLGSTQEQVAEILGDPDENSSSDIRWRYYSKEYMSILDQINKVIGEEEKAFEKGDENALLRLANEEARLNEQLENVKYDYIEIEFTGGKKDGFTVSSVFFEKNRCDSNTETAKTVKNYSVLTEYYYKNVNKIAYRTYFADGSYYSAWAKPTVKENQGTIVKLIWSDKFYTEYEVNLKMY